MELFIDSVDLGEIKAAADFGFMEGITTTPTFMHQQGIKDVDGTIVELSEVANQLHVEALGETCSEIMAEAERLSALPGLTKKPVFKIPVTNEGLKAANRLVKGGYKTNIHLVYTLTQAYLAATSGATYICPLVGRLHDQGHDSFALIEQVVHMVERYRYPAKVMVSSVRHPDHVRMAILCGAHAITLPWRVLRVLSDNVLTGRGVSDFTTHTRLTTYTVVSVVNGEGRLIGILTDGDLRRAIDRKDLAYEKVVRLMSENPKCVPEETLLQDAVEFLRKAQVDNLVVVDVEEKPVGMIDVQDLLRDGLTD